MTGLEAFERMTEHLDLEDEYSYTQERKDEEIIEKALQRLESIDNSEPSEALELLRMIKFKSINAGYNYGFGYWIKIEQALIKAQEQEKVLDIIWNKKVDLWRLLFSQTLEDYNTYIMKTGGFTLTQEEFDLLKETLKP